MRLTDEQIARFESDGYLFLPEQFSSGEIATLMAAAHRIFGLRREEIVRERDSGVVRTAFAAHTYSEAFRRLSRHPRLVEPAMQLLGGPIYMHQFKVNAKAAFDGDVWQWHQDYGTWKRDDLMPEPRAMNVALFLEEVNEFNGPLLFIAGSHRGGTLAAGHDRATTSYPLWTIDSQTVRQLIEAGGLASPKGPPGSVLLFHCNLVHGSSSNMSPWSRTIVYLSACHVDNHIRQFKRPEWIAHRDFTPVECLSDDCLLALGQDPD